MNTPRKIAFTWRIATTLTLLGVVLAVQSQVLLAQCQDCAEINCSEPGCCHSCGKGLWEREQLFGDLWCVRPAMADHGITIDSSLTQFYQGVASGGDEQIFRYGAKFDLFFDLDTEKMGLWSGGSLLIHVADWQFGQNSLADATPVSAVNTNLLMPNGEPGFAITHFMYQQELGGGYVGMLGRYNLLDLWTGFYPDYGRGVDGFMNLNMLIPFNVVTAGFDPVSNLAGIVKAGERGLEAGFMVTETQNSPTTVGLDFPNGVTLFGFVRKFTDFAGLSGSHLLLGTYATGDFTNLDSSGWIINPPGLPTPTTRTGSWSAGYIGEQRVWEDPCNAKRYTNLFGYAGWTGDETNPLGFTAALTLEAFGRLDSRPNDRMGIGYFYTGLGNDFQNLLNVLEPAGDLHGGEVYYNHEVTPWFHVTGDLQAIRPVFRERDTVLVLGLRAKIEF